MYYIIINVVLHLVSFIFSIEIIGKYEFYDWFYFSRADITALLFTQVSGNQSLLKMTKTKCLLSTVNIIAAIKSLSLNSFK